MSRKPDYAAMMSKVNNAKSTLKAFALLNMRLDARQALDLADDLEYVLAELEVLSSESPNT